MRDGIFLVWLVLGLGACGSPSRGTGESSEGGGGPGGTMGHSGAAGAGQGGSLGGASAAAGSAGHGAGQAGGSGTAGTSGQSTTGNAGSTQSGGRGGEGGTANDSGMSGAGGTGPGGSAGSSAGASGAPGGAGSGGQSGSAGMTNAGSGPGGAAGSATCAPGRSPLTAGDSTVTMQHGGRSRKYIQHVPPGLTAGTPSALVLDLHGAGGNGAQQKGLSGFSALADKERFLVVFPDGIDGYWNVDDKCCGTAGNQKIDDVGFLEAIISALSEKTCIDRGRIYVSGFSNGGGLAHRMGCDAADLIAAIAPTATDLRTDPCNASRPISMMEIKGMADSLEPYEGGLVGPSGGQYVAVGAKASLALWAALNQCTGTTTKIDNYCESYQDCAGGVETALCSLPAVDHDVYGNSLGFNVAAVAWSMFKRHSLK